MCLWAEECWPEPSGSNILMVKIKMVGNNGGWMKKLKAPQTNFAPIVYCICSQGREVPDSMAVCGLGDNDEFWGAALSLKN